MPCRISFRVASRQESRIVLDQNGADVLLGRGDMLVLEPGTSNLTRAQGTYVDDSEIRGVVKALRRGGEPQYNAELMRLGQAGSARDGAQKRDELFDDAARRGSVSLLQRRLSIGYSRASRIIDQMADAGLLGDYKGSQARECLMTLEDWQSYKASVEADQSGESAADGEPTSS
jgi:S-DNA-T family DNA segregation ATPase FtsK/SpoIIIE